MYARGGTLAAAAGTLPVTGFDVAWTILAAVTLITVGAALLRLVPARGA